MILSLETFESLELIRSGFPELGPTVSIITLIEEELDVFDEVEEISPDSYEEQEKVTTLAIDKFVNGEVKWRK